MDMKRVKLISFAVFLATIAVQMKPAAAQTYTTSGNQIQSNGANWCAGGANAFDQFGTGSSSGHGIKVMREVVENLSGCIMGSGTQSWNGSTLHGLQDVVNNNRSQGEITILCPFSWDTSGVITGGDPSGYSWYTSGAYATQLAAMATQFSGQSDVWIDPWNEPNFSSQTDWNGFATTVYNAIRGAGNSNIILMPSNSWDSDEGSYINGTGWLSGKSNVTATIHIYSGWDWDTAANIQSRLQNILNSGWPVIVGEIGPDSYQSDPIRGIQATIATHIPTLAWAWNSGDGDQLQNGGTLTSWGTEWFNNIGSYVPAAASISYVQGASNGGSSSASSRSVSFPSSQHSGDLNVVLVGWDPTATVSSVTDSAGNTYTRAVGPTTRTNAGGSIYYAHNIAGAGNTVTVTFTGTALYPDVQVMEFSGVHTLDKTATGSGNSSSASTSSATTTAAKELIIGSCVNDQSIAGAGSGFTLGPNDSFGYGGEYKIVSSTGSYNASMSLTGSGNWIMQMATFKP